MEGFSATQEIMGCVMRRSSVWSSFPVLLICLAAILCSSLLTSIIRQTDMTDQSQEIGTMLFVLLLMCVTLLAPCPTHDDGILLFCIRVFCVAYVCASTFLVVYLLM